jgi:hypothetical protein
LADASVNAGARRSPDRVGDTGCGRCADMVVLRYGIVLRVEVEILRRDREEHGDVWKNGIAAVGD